MNAQDVSIEDTRASLSEETQRLTLAEMEGGVLRPSGDQDGWVDVDKLIPNIMLFNEKITHDVQGFATNLESELRDKHKNDGLELHIIPILYKANMSEYETDSAASKIGEHAPIRLCIISNNKVPQIDKDIENAFREIKNINIENRAIASHMIDTSKPLAGQVDKIEEAMNATYFNHFYNKRMLEQKDNGEHKDNADDAGARLTSCYFASLSTRSQLEGNIKGKLNAIHAKVAGKDVLAYRFGKYDVQTQQPMALDDNDKKFFKAAAQYWMDIFESATFVQDDKLPGPEGLHGRYSSNTKSGKTRCTWDTITPKGGYTNR